MISDSYGTRKINVPLMKPLDAAMWCSKRALDEKGLPTFLFFENRQLPESKQFQQEMVLQHDKINCKSTNYFSPYF